MYPSFRKGPSRTKGALREPIRIDIGTGTSSFVTSRTHFAVRAVR